MLLYLLILFTVIPLIEVFLLGWLWSEIGLLWTILLVLGTGFAGATLARWQGIKVVRRIERRISRGQMPADELFDGALLLVAGCLLITPGILTDVFGLLLLFSPFRRLLRIGLKAWATKNVVFRATSFAARSAETSSPPRDPSVVEGKVVEVRNLDD